MTLAAGTPIGKYVIQSKLAEGGMAELYLATALGPEGFEKEVVIKRVRSFLSDDEGFVRMFIAEARLVSRLNHANVVQIFDFDKHGDSYYLAMEYVSGGSLWELRKRCRDRGIPMPPVLVAHIGAQVAAGLGYAHRVRSPEGEPLHLVHRDVTPQNVLLSLDGAVKLTDFGIAKAGNTLTQPGVLKGKFAYMSPEQARGEAVDARTDVFALGVVLWEMLTGGRLFEGDSDMAVLRAVQESVIVPPARLNPDVPESLDVIVTTALQRDPAARYPSAGEMERALAQCVLRCATSVDDTDVGAFVRRVFDAPRSRSLPMPSALREATAVLPGGRTGRPGPSEDSMAFESTLVLPREMTRSEEGSPPPAQVPASPPLAPPSAVAPSPPPTVPADAVPVKVARGNRSLWGGVGLVAILLVGGGVVWRVSSRPQDASPTPVAASLPGPVPPTRVTADPAPPPSPVVAATPPAPEPSRAEATPPPAAPAAPVTQAKGTLVLKAVPYADVYLNDQLLKRELQQPWSVSLAPGVYKLKFTHPSRTDSSEITITPNGRVVKSFTVPRR